jgi:hypothetical protein
MTRRSFDLVLFDSTRFAAILRVRFTLALLRFEGLLLRVAVRFFGLAMIASFVSGIPPRSSTLANLPVIRHAADPQALS